MLTSDKEHTVWYISIRYLSEVLQTNTNMPGVHSMPDGGCVVP